MSSLSLPVLIAAVGLAGPVPAHGNLQGLFSGDDYPLVALRKDEQGKVTVRLEIDPAGMVSECKVIESSGSQSLDAQTCAVIRARAQFSPAKDGRGRPVKDSYTQTIRWQLAGEKAAPLPRQPWMIRTRLGMSKLGKIVNCKLESTGTGDLGDDCKAMMALMDKMRLADTSVPAELYMITETYFYPVAPDKASEAPRLTSANQLARLVGRIEITAEGTVANCEIISGAQDTPPGTDPCQIMAAHSFIPAPAGTPDLDSTFFVTFYAQAQTIS